MTPKQTSKEFLKSVAITVPNKRRKITLAILIIAVSLSVAIEFAVAAAFTQGYSTPADSYKNTLYIGKHNQAICSGIASPTKAACSFTINIHS